MAKKKQFVIVSEVAEKESYYSSTTENNVIKYTHDKADAKVFVSKDEAQAIIDEQISKTVAYLDREFEVKEF